MNDKLRKNEFLQVIYNWKQWKQASYVLSRTFQIPNSIRMTNFISLKGYLLRSELFMVCIPLWKKVSQIECVIYEQLKKFEFDRVAGPSVWDNWLEWDGNEHKLEWERGKTEASFFPITEFQIMNHWFRKVFHKPEFILNLQHRTQNSGLLEKFERTCWPQIKSKRRKSCSRLAFLEQKVSGN